MLEGGYVLFLVFRGDNTVPIYQTKFSSLHNRCLMLLSTLVRDGHQGWWDNLYPSLDVMQELASGGTYEVAFPSLLLFQSLIFPLTMLPMILSNAISLSVALKRLDRFMQVPPFAQPCCVPQLAGGNPNLS